MAMVLPQSVMATIMGEINEVEDNNSLATAQDIESSFYTGSMIDIRNSDLSGWEWVSISGTGDGTYDYYSFTAQAGQEVIFDIDYGVSFGDGSIDAVLGLWSSSGGSPLWQNDDCYYTNGLNMDCSTDQGSLSSFDPGFSWVIEEAGLYIVGVGMYNSYGFPHGDGFFGRAPSEGSTYTLQVSRNMATVPEPTTLALMWLGLIGVGLTSIVTRKNT